MAAASGPPRLCGYPRPYRKHDGHPGQLRRWGVALWLHHLDHRPARDRQRIGDGGGALYAGGERRATLAGLSDHLLLRPSRARQGDRRGRLWPGGGGRNADLAAHHRRGRGDGLYGRGQRQPKNGGHRGGRAGRRGADSGTLPAAGRARAERLRGRRHRQRPRVTGGGRGSGETAPRGTPSAQGQQLWQLCPDHRAQNQGGPLLGNRPLYRRHRTGRSAGRTAIWTG